MPTPSPNWSQVVLPENWQTAGFGLYIHWPFCAAKCPYCDFNSHVVSSIDQIRWKDAYVSEIKRFGAETEGRLLSSVFFGGGTPSLMDAALVEAILDTVRDTWVLANNVEITLEANPTSAEATRFQGYRDAGVNRLSLGVQALNDPDLKVLGRLHTASEAVAALSLARSIFDRCSFDLIYARQHQSLSEWESELSEALSFGVDHLSLYQLSIEDGTSFGDRMRRGRLAGLPNEDLAADMFQLTNELCASAGLSPYEVSNYAETGQESRHNLIYWNAGDYAGIGPGAHGRLSFGKKRLATDTPLQPAQWLDLVEQSGCGERSREALSADARHTETLMMGLRTKWGVPLDRLNVSSDFLRRARSLDEAGLIVLQSNQIFATPAGRAVLNSVLQELL